MKKAMAVAALAAPFILVPGVALANTSTGGGGSTGSSSVSINQYADFNFNGTQLDVGLQVKCTGGSGLVDVAVTQPYPESPDPLGAQGTGIADVVCDGKTHPVGATIVGVIYDAGNAKASATLTAPSGTKKASRSITIVVV
jgi:hypothetical protein